MWDGNYTRILHAVLNRSWMKYPTKQQLYDHLPPILQSIQVKWARYAGHQWRRKDELIGVVHQYTPCTWIHQCWHSCKIYIQQVCADTACSLDDLSRDGWWKRFKRVPIVDTIWWWWWWWCGLILNVLFIHFLIVKFCKVFFQILYFRKVHKLQKIPKRR